MTEIELKAHVYNREELLQKLNTFAEFKKTVIKNDTYYRLDLDKPVKGSGHISARIRIETEQKPEKTEEKIFLTYKRKEVRTAANGLNTEVNDEKESLISDAEAVITLLSDIGFKEALKKKKTVSVYTCPTQHGEATLELCLVEPLGWFLEIEILSPEKDYAAVEEVQKELKKLLSKSGIPEKDIETRYYSELLKTCNNS